MKNITRLTNLILFFSTIIITFSGIIGSYVYQICLYVIVICLSLEAVLMRWTPFQLVCFGVILVSSIVVSLSSGQNVANALIFSSSVIFIIQGVNGEFSPQSWYFIKKCTYIVSLVFIILFFVNPNWTSNNKLTLIFENSNMTGIVCSIPTIFLLLMIVENLGKIGNIVNWILFIILFYFVILTQNRSSLICVLLILICALVDVLSSKRKRLTSPFVFTLLKLSPLIMMIVYVVMFNFLPHDFILFGKPLFSGRELFWGEAIKSFLSNPFSLRGNISGTLNFILEIFERYGAIALIAFYILLFSVKMKNVEGASSVQYLAFISFLFCLLQQSFESTLVTGSYCSFVWFYSLIGISFMKDNAQSKL